MACDFTLKGWLKCIVGLPQYTDNFINNGYNEMDVIIEMVTSNKLKAMGINIMGHRDKIIFHINKLISQSNNDATSAQPKTKSKRKSKKKAIKTQSSNSKAT